MAELRALIVDYGGVLTTPLGEAMAGWCASDGIDHAAFGQVMREWLSEDVGAGSARVEAAVANPVHLLETGELSVAEFERELVRRLVEAGGLGGRSREEAEALTEGLLTRMFAGFRREPTMVDVLRTARAHGLKVGLLSNSWGLDYPRDDWAELFDDTVISGEVGLRKPDPAIYELAASRLGLATEQCVFVDDLRPNVRAAAAVGMVGVHHRSVAETVTELEAVLGVSLSGGARS